MSNRDFKIHVLGSGGAWDYEEGHSAFYVTCNGCTPFLIDCGSTVQHRLLKLLNSTERLIEENHIIVTHTHEDHIGSLSTNIYQRYFQSLIRGGEAITNIICTPEVRGLLNQKLLLINGHNVGQFSFKEPGIFQELGVSIAFIDTSGHHTKTIPSSGIIMRSKGGEYLIVSGDINKPIFPLIKSQYPKVYSDMNERPEKVIILHDMTTYDYEESPHCFYKLILDYKEKYPYIYAYHHDKGQMEALNQVGWVNFCGDFIGRNIKI